MVMTKQAVEQRQNTSFELIMLKVDESAVDATELTSDGLLEGQFHAKIEKTATGAYSIRLNRKSLRPVQIVGYGLVTVDSQVSFTAVDEEGVDLVVEVGGTDTNSDFWLTLGAFYNRTER